MHGSADSSIIDSRRNPPPAPGEPERKQEVLQSLMEGYQRGSEDAVRDLVRRLSPLLLGYFRRPSQTRPYAEDMLQECWLRVHKARHSFRPGSPVMPWLFAIARHTRVDVYRRRNKIDAAEVVAGDEPLSTRHRWCSPRSPSIGLWKLVDRLPPKQREVIHLAKRWGLTLEEVAQTTDTTVAAVKQRTHRAYLTLRADLAAGLGSAATNE